MAQPWYITQCPANRSYLGSVINLAVLTPDLKMAFSDWPEFFFFQFLFKFKSQLFKSSSVVLICCWLCRGVVVSQHLRAGRGELSLTLLQTMMWHKDWWGESCLISEGQKARNYRKLLSLKALICLSCSFLLESLILLHPVCNVHWSRYCGGVSEYAESYSSFRARWLKYWTPCFWLV